MFARIAAVVLSGVVLSVIAWRRFDAATSAPPTPDPFGTDAQVRASLDPTIPAFIDSLPVSVQSVAAREIATRGKFRGDPRELAPFLDLLGGIGVPATTPTEEQWWNVERSQSVLALTALARAWASVGPYSSLTDRVRAEAIRFARHPEEHCRIHGGLLVEALLLRGDPAGDAGLHAAIAPIRSDPVLGPRLAAQVKSKLMIESPREQPDPAPHRSPDK